MDNSLFVLTLGELDSQGKVNIHRVIHMIWITGRLRGTGTPGGIHLQVPEGRWVSGARRPPRQGDWKSPGTPGQTTQPRVSTWFPAWRTALSSLRQWAVRHQRASQVMWSHLVNLANQVNETQLMNDMMQADLHDVSGHHLQMKLFPHTFSSNVPVAG